MIIAGARGLAKQLMPVISELKWNDDILFYDSDKNLVSFYDKRVFHDFESVKGHFESDPRFILAVGKPHIRKKVCEQMEACGGQLFSLISTSSTISNDVLLEPGVTILTSAILENGSRVGKGTLINLAALVCHDVRVGRFAEISPGAILLGESSVGDYTFIGSGAIVNPGVKVGSNVTIGSGTVVIRDVPDGVTLVGIPGRVLSKTSDS